MTTQRDAMHAALEGAREAVTVLEHAAGALDVLESKEQLVRDLEARKPALEAEIQALIDRRDVEAKAYAETQARAEHQHGLARQQAQAAVSTLTRQVAENEGRLATLRETMARETAEAREALDKLAQERVEAEKDLQLARAAHQAELAKMAREAKDKQAALDGARQRAEAQLAEAQERLRAFHGELAELTKGSA